MEIEINDYTAAVIECIFGQMRDEGQQDITDAAAYLYNFVRREGIYPPQVVGGFHSAYTVISELTRHQFLILKSIIS